MAGITSLSLLLSVLALPVAVTADTGTDSDHKYAWGENVGWASAQSAEHNVMIHYDEGTGGWLSGHVWAANIGWIVMGSAAGGPYDNTTDDNWGINLAANGELSGYAWGENVGWINFEQTHGQPAINPANGEFSGHAWGENIGWVSLRGSAPDYGVRTLAFDTQPKGTPNWWLARHGVTEEYDAGDGVPASAKYLMDVNPNVASNYLRIDSVEIEDGEVAVSFSPASPRRHYMLLSRSDLTGANTDWLNMPQSKYGAPDQDGLDILIDQTAESINFYGIAVALEPSTDE
jgi:hypothetical protein